MPPARLYFDHDLHWTFTISGAGKRHRSVKTG
jgi:hypothetical protein